MIKVKLFGDLKTLMPDTDAKGFWIINEDNLSISDILMKAGVSDTSVQFNTLVNNVRKAPDYILHDGDYLAVIPLFAGG
ncbi:MAG: hypothetical protein WBH44_02025 [Proteocatella sp.]